MNDTTPLPPNTPDRSETARLPETASSPAPGPVPGAADPAPPARRRNLLLGAGIAAAALVIAGAGAAIALSIDRANDERDEPALVSGTVSPGTDDDRTGRTADDDDGNGDDLASPDPVPTTPNTDVPADAEALVDAIDAAVAEAGGAGATSIEVERDGWDVDVVMDDRREIDVHVALDGTATVRSTGDDDDRDSDPLLDTARVPAIVDAALAAAGGGAVESISTDDGRVRYEVSVDLGGNDVDVELAEDLGVVAVDDD
ncbi:hypothetical protein [Leucobacter sp.]